MAITATVVSSSDWTEVAADITAVTAVQVARTSTKPMESQLGAEFAVAASKPAGSALGILVYEGDTVTSTYVAEWGASGKIYARALGPSVSVRIAAS